MTAKWPKSTDNIPAFVGTAFIIEAMPICVGCRAEFDCDHPGRFCSLRCRDRASAEKRRQEAVEQRRVAHGLPPRPPADPPTKNVWSATGELLAEARRVKPPESPLPAGIPRSRTTGGLGSVNELLAWMHEGH
jgi:hypothetical protein